MAGEPIEIVIAGPAAAQPFLARLRETIARPDRTIHFLVGTEAVGQFDRWQYVQLLIPFALPFTAADMDLAPSLKAIVVPSLGYEGIDVDAARARGIVVANGAVQENFESVAEAAIMLILMCLYDIRQTEQRLRDGVSRQGPAQARMLRGKTVGLIGFGNIARAVAVRLAAWQVRLIAYSRSTLAPDTIGVEQVDLETLISQSDIVLPLVPLTRDTQDMLSREVLSRLKSGAVLVNLSRGGVIDEEALADPAIYGRLGGLALDVFTQEPLALDSPLRQVPGAILTPHEISHTKENFGALFELAVRNVEAVLRGATPETALN
ncbi:NAD(P)-dependent oxidoreductase [Novosphingobium sp. JCM 18896]|uniref:NAD(P)-dependent oxidoreductase n=1 Tax=Novosphingobium sp. JCM 18896 TaxID=2989731 RepID=UPI002223159A|nr:NAD(P)-dependent oxidoreductase [Novosphingobium sp. JCM 18896]MCW1432314.1 D-3-phosphoglycerate dehydrogenase [Novosphingobium sp. JCM 18896]